MGARAAKIGWLGALAIAATVTACGGTSKNQTGSGSAGTSSSGATSSGGSNGGGEGNAAGDSTSGGSAGTTAATGGSAGQPAVMIPPGPMKLISRGVPSFASSGTAESANDAQPNIAWSADALPAWLAFDLSGVPEKEKQQVLLAWYCYYADYLVAEPKPEQMLPIDYAVEIHGDPGGGAPPASDWIEVGKVTENTRSARQHVFSFERANWVRMVVSKSSHPAKVMVDMDIYTAPNGGTDAWLFMGDSITYMTTQRAFSDLPELVDQNKPGRVPLVIDGALGGTNTTTAQAIIDDSLAQFDGRYVVLAYGTNDHANEFQMESLVEKVIATGKVPVVPHVPWSDQKLEEGPSLNEQIDALYEKYPAILHGPDLWQAFENRLDLIPSGDVHPNAEGMQFLRNEWSKTISAAEQ